MPLTEQQKEAERAYLPGIRYMKIEVVNTKPGVYVKGQVAWVKHFGDKVNWDKKGTTFYLCDIKHLFVSQQDFEKIKRKVQW